MGRIPRHERAVLPFKEGQDAGCFHLCRRLELHYSRRQLLANAAIAASRVGS